MTTCKRVLALGGGLLLGMASVVHADATTSGSDADLKAELSAVKARLAELEGRQNDNWLNERRAEEVKALVRDVLADSNTRSSLQGGSATLSHNGNNFVFTAENNKFQLNVWGEINVRYILNVRAGDSPQGGGQTDGAGNLKDSQDKWTSGFEIPFAKIGFEGFIADPRIEYKLVINAEREFESVRTEEVLLSFQLADGVKLWAGETKGPFMREEIVDDAHQLAVDRSVLNTIFSIGRVQGVGLLFEGNDFVHANISINDGHHSGEPFDDQGTFFDKSFLTGASDFAITGRVDVKVMGEWNQLKDFNAWDGKPTGLFIGTAVHYEYARNGSGQTDNNGGFIPNESFVTWTVDGTFKSNGFSFFAAVVGRSSQGINDTSGLNSTPGNDSIGAMGQASFFVVPNKVEPFVRFEWFTADDDNGSFGTSGPNDVSILTTGANFYMAKHAAKFTLDVVWAFGSLHEDNTLGADLTNLGLQSDTDGKHENQVAIRAQFQLLF